MRHTIRSFLDMEQLIVPFSCEQYCTVLVYSNGSGPMYWNFFNSCCKNYYLFINGIK